ncbi:MAG TPA: response regulator transcription factor [Bacteroidetes bacterium]|nr:response regulator transcription factor [Bacteroidota bacterium]
MSATTDKITTIIVDDEQDAIDVLKFIIGKYCPELEVVATAHSADEAQEKIATLRPFLLLLDINIASTSGGRNTFDFLPNLPDYPCEIVFITAYDQYAIRAIKLHAFDYLLKPVEAGELMEMAQKLRERVAMHPMKGRLVSLAESSATSSEIWLPVRNGLRKVLLDEILWVKAEEHYSRIGLASNEVLFASKSFKELRELLEVPAFFCTHRSYLIQLNKIRELRFRGDSQVCMQDGTKVPVARNRKKEFLQLIGKT